MSINIGVPVNNLPAPVTTGGTQSFTDVYGEQWVARPSAYAGSWRKARDVLHSVIYRNAAYTMTTGSAVFPYDTVLRDTYGLFSANGFIVPVAGWYWIQATGNGNSSAIGQYIQGSVTQNGTIVSSDNSVTSLASGGNAFRTWAEIICAANDVIKASIYNPSGLAAQVGQANARLEISYIGTG